MLGVKATSRQHTQIQSFFERVLGSAKRQVLYLGELLIDIHGQHAHQSLMHRAHQRELLDAFAGNSALAAELSDTWRAWKELGHTIETLEKMDEIARLLDEVATDEMRELIQAIREAGCRWGRSSTRTTSNSSISTWSVRAIAMLWGARVIRRPSGS